MAITETRSESETGQDDPSLGRAPANTVEAVIGSADHKTIGRSWIISGLLLLLGSLVVSLVAAIEAVDLGGYALTKDADQFTQVWSLGREMLIFGAVVPLLVGLATFLVPMQVGAPAIAFARGASGAFWVWLTGIGLTVAAYIANGGPGGGRTDFVVLWVFGLGMALIGLTWALVTVATTAMAARTTGMTFDLVPYTTWGFFIFALVGIVTLPVVMADLVVAYFNVSSGVLGLENSQTLAGVADSVSMAPALFWLAIPVVGMGADIIGVHVGRPLQPHRSMLVVLAALGVAGYGADLVGLGGIRHLDQNNFFSVAGIALASVMLLAVLGLLVRSVVAGTPAVGAPLVGSLVAVVLFLLAAAASLLALAEPLAVSFTENTALDFDLDRLLVLSGTTFHDGIRGLAVGATIVGLATALHHWSPKLWGRTTNSSLTFFAVLAGAVGAVLWGLGAIVAGIDDQAAYPVSELVGGDLVEPMNSLAMIGVAAVLAAALLVLANTIQAALSSGSADPAWSGGTLEWATDTPPAFGNFASAPVVRSAAPVFDQEDSGDDEGEDV